jgi:cleavage and polyadenylation specificity factor subunit 2
MTNVSDPIQIRLVPLLGGREYGAVCSLLEIGNSRILLDCGRLISTSVESISRIKDFIKNTTIDAILLTHADMAHIGALPLLFGVAGDSLFLLSNK